MEGGVKFVAIPTFVNPHLFWIIESNSEERNKTLHFINKLMQDDCTNYKNDYFEVGELVAVLLDGKHYRAVIEDIPNAETHGNVNRFLCWLIDFGVICETDKIYKLPARLKQIAPLASQASLNDVAYVRQSLTYDQESGLPVKINKPVLTPSSVAHQVSLELMSNLSDLQFKMENKIDGILVGDILYKENQELKSLRETLIDKAILTLDEMVFKDILENIYNYKDTHLGLITQICRKLNSIQYLTENKPWHTKIIAKYLAEFEGNDFFDDFELTRPLHSRRSRSRNSGNESFNSESGTISDTEALNKSECINSCKEKSPGNNRIRNLLEKMKNQKSQHLKSSDVSSSSTTDIDESCDAGKNQPAAQERIQLTKEKNGNFACKDTNVLLNSEKEKDGQWPSTVTKKRVLPSNAVFVPGGASFTLKQMKKKDKENAPKNPHKESSPCPKVSSDDDTSDCKTKKVVNKHSPKESSPSDEAATDDNNGGNDETAGANQLKVKPFCTCRQCDHWTNDNDWSVETKFLHECKRSKHLTVNKPQPLFVHEENEHLASDRRIISLNYSSKTKLQKQSMLKQLVHGEYSQSPVRTTSEVCFHESIRDSLHQLQYREAKRIQIYTWPAIFRQQNVVMVNGPQTGKTMAYLPVILTFLLEKNERYEQFLSKTNGPIAVILCANTKKCEEIYDLSKALLGRSRLKVSLITYPLSHINTKYMDLLVVTPTILMELLKSKQINFKRLCHLILEDGNKILNLAPEIMSSIFDLTQSMLSNRVHPKPVQLIICAEHWESRLENLLRKLSKVPLICIGNYLEAVLYGKIQFSMKFLDSAYKEHELKNLLKDTFRFCKSVILCKEEEIEEIQTILMLKGIDATIISESLSKEDILYLEEVWTQCKGGDYTVLVCTDFLLHTLLTVTSASLLIHYSLPNSWTQFVKRFGCLLENCHSPIDNKPNKMKCQSVVLCDEQCEHHMSKFFTFINSTELRNQMSDKFKRFSEGLRYSEEEKKMKNKIGLCDALKLFGKCPATHCPWRHIVYKELDISSYLPQAGQIKFKIVQIHDVTNYSVQLIQHTDMEGHTCEFADGSDLEELTTVMKVSRKQVAHPVVGQQYAYYDFDELDGVYYRCCLLDVDENRLARIKLVDKGNMVKVEISKLFRLPKEFRNIPPKVVDVYLANFIPPYHDENFSARSFFNLKNLLEKHDYKNMTLTGDIHLQMGNTLWLKNVYEEVILSERIIPNFQLSREVLMLKLAEYSNNQLNNLYKLCIEAKIALPVYEKPVKRAIREERKIEPQWAHLDADVNEVTFSAAISPDEIYVRLNKFNGQLYSLQKEIQENLRKANYPKLENVEPGTICLAKDPEGLDYARVLIKRVENGKALCFFVDFGDEAVTDVSELKYIHNKSITKLPFQSIQCRLYGIKPVLEDCEDNISSMLYKYATEPDTDIFRLLFVKYCDKEENIVHPRQNRYSVLLKDGFGEKRVLINRLLIDCGVAISDSEEIEDFHIYNNSFSTDDETDEELERLIDICKKTDEAEENGRNVDAPIREQDIIDDDMELFILNDVEFFKSIMMGTNNPRSENDRELPPIQAAPPVDYCTPEVYWSQTEICIKMNIELPDVDQYNLSLTKGTILRFKTVKNEKTYKLNLMLYQRVSSVQHSAMGLQVRVTLTKAKCAEWPRLTLSKQRARNIHFDVSTIDVKEDTKKILEFPGLIDDDDEDENDKIDMMYHVGSDLDSDMDAELPNDSD